MRYPERITRVDRSRIEEYLAAPLWLPERAVREVVTADVFTPKSFDEYIGQSEAKDLAKIMMEAARKENRRLPNIMIVGEYGLGKTALAKLIIEGAGYPVNLLDGASVNNNIPTEGTVLIDEIHNVESQVADTLNIFLDKGSLTIVGATTDPGQLPLAFRSRFRTLFLEDYSTEELTLILKNVCERKKVTATLPALKAIAERSRNNARVGTNNLAFIFDLMVANSNTEVTVELARKAFNKLGIDDRGFLKWDHRYLAALPLDGRPVGLQYLAAKIGVDQKTIENELEPFLMRLGLIDRTPRGRIKL